MSGIPAAMLPGSLVLLDTDDHWAQRPLRGQRGVIVHRYEPGIGSAIGADVVVCIGPCGKARHTVDCHTAVAFKTDELIPVPAAATPFPCCTHCSSCPAADGHPVPCTSCQHPATNSPDQQAARAMARADRYGVGIGPAT